METRDGARTQQARDCARSHVRLPRPHQQVRGGVRDSERRAPPLHQADRHGHGAGPDGPQPHLGLHPRQARLLPHANLQARPRQAPQDLADATRGVPVQHHRAHRRRQRPLRSRAGLRKAHGRPSSRPNPPQPGEQGPPGIGVDVHPQTHYPDSAEPPLPKTAVESAGRDPGEADGCTRTRESKGLDEIQVRRTSCLSRRSRAAIPSAHGV